MLLKSLVSTIAVASLSSAISGTAWAAQRAVSSVQDATDIQLQGCDQACLYHRSVEALELERLTILKRIEVLSSIGYSDAEVRSSLGSFCLPAEQPKDCVSRYSQLQLRRLQQIKAQMAYNSDAALRLSADADALLAGKKPSEKTPPIAVPSRGAPVSPRSLLPSQPLAYEDLMKKVRARAGWMPKREEVKAAAKEYLKGPNPADFVKMKEIARSPGDPSQGTLLVVERDGNGNPVLDTEAFQHAKKEFEEHLTSMAGALQSQPDGAWDQAASLDLNSPGRDPMTQAAKTAYEDAYVDLRQVIHQTLAKRSLAAQDKHQFVRAPLEQMEKDLEAVRLMVKRQ